MNLALDAPAWLLLAPAGVVLVLAIRRLTGSRAPRLAAVLLAFATAAFALALGRPVVTTPRSAPSPAVVLIDASDSVSVPALEGAAGRVATLAQEDAVAFVLFDDAGVTFVGDGDGRERETDLGRAGATEAPEPPKDRGSATPAAQALASQHGVRDRCIQVTGLPSRTALPQIRPGFFQPGFIVSGNSFGPIPSKLVNDLSNP